MWRRSAPRIPLFTIFHELYATGWPWQSSFWLSPVQKRIARNILNLSSGVVVPTDLHRKRLLQWRACSDIEITRMSVFSNVGEPGCGLPSSARPPTAVVFGLASVEDRTFGRYRSEIEQIVKILGINKILDVGPRVSSVPSTLAGVPLVSKGVLPRAAVSELLQQAKFGFVVYPFDVLGKSGVFAAYAAHGIVPIVFPERRGSFDGLEAGRHFLDGLHLETSVGADALVMIQSQLFSWYASHSLHVQASFLERSIRSVAAVQLIATSAA
jgi:hypothetical protein